MTHWVPLNNEWFPDYVGKIADNMGLRDWKIIIMPDPPPDNGDGQEAGAYNEVIYGRKVVKLSFAIPDTREELRHWVVHELIHCHMAPIEWTIRSISPTMSQQTYDVWHGSIEDAIEIATDAMATEWAELMPLPQEIMYEESADE